MTRALWGSPRRRRWPLDGEQVAKLLPGLAALAVLSWLAWSCASLMLREAEGRPREASPWLGDSIARRDHEARSADTDTPTRIQSLTVRVGTISTQGHVASCAPASGPCFGEHGASTRGGHLFMRLRAALGF